MSGSFLGKEENIRWMICSLYLAACALQDFRRQKIGIRLSAFTGCAAVLLDIAAMYAGGTALLQYLWGLLPGILLLVLKYVSRGAAGTGDGICFLVVGLLLEGRMTWILLICALILAAFVGGGLLLLRKAGPGTRMPFLVFAAASWAGILTVRLSGINW